MGTKEFIRTLGFVLMIARSVYPKEITGLAEIVDQYDIFLVDIIGVVSNGIRPFSNAISCLQKLQKTKKVIFVSNVPRPGTVAVQKLISMGLSADTKIMTSGDAVRHDLERKFAHTTVYHLGQERNEDLCADMPVYLCTDLRHAKIVLLSQFIEQDEPLDQFDELLQNIANTKISVFCANPDKIASQGETTRVCAGTFAERLEKMGGYVKYYGKPYRTFYEQVAKKYEITVQNKPRVLMIGDTLETDIQGAYTYGIDSLLVLGGNTGQAIRQSQHSILEYLKNKISPTWYSTELRD